MNSVVVTLCVLFALAVLPAPTIRGVLATAAASLFEGAPFILAGIAAHALLSRLRVGRGVAPAIVAALGCGCGGGASARSLPAAVATAMVFGPVPAAARLVAAALLTHLCHPERSERSERSRGTASLLAQLHALLPTAVLAGIALHLFGNVRVEAAPPLVQWLGGAVFGILASPCALGAVALAASLHARAAYAAVGMLCVCGIVDVRAFARGHAHDISHDALAYATSAVAFAIVALRTGDALVHPHFAIPLACCAVACTILAVAHRRALCTRARIAPALMLLGALLVAPAPVYTATETTLSDLFPGERLVFTGTLVHGKDADALVRFAITCCRADAAPVVVRLARRLPYPASTWLRAEGEITTTQSEFRLATLHANRISPPSDPFTYR